MTFTDFGLDARIAAILADSNFTTPTPIQARSIPVVLEGRDVLAAAQTGTGKTLAFALPVLNRLAAEAKPAAQGRRPRVLVLVPTRELAAQVAESFALFAPKLGLTHAVIFGGVGHRPQEDALRRGLDIVIATPGRLLDHAGNRVADLSGIETLILDEADRMLDMGFIHDIKRVLKLLPQKRQNLLFSATFSDDIRTLIKGLLHDPVSIEVAARNTTAERVSHRLYKVEGPNKATVLSGLLRQQGLMQTLVFTRTKHGANRLSEQLARDGIKTAAIHGNKSQSARTKALEDFKTGRIEVLVATDIAARGIDISELPLVVNYELPHVPEDYVHRIGRTGRNGLSGDAFSLVSSDERDRLRQIERMLGRAVPVEPIPGDLPAPPPPVAGVVVRAEDRPPLVRGGGRGGHGRGHGQGQGGGQRAPARQDMRGGGNGPAPQANPNANGGQGQRAAGADNGFASTNGDNRPAEHRDPRPPRRDGGQGQGGGQGFGRHAEGQAAPAMSYAPTGNGFGRTPAPRPSHADGVARRFADGHGHSAGPRRDQRTGPTTPRPA